MREKEREKGRKDVEKRREARRDRCAGVEDGRMRERERKGGNEDEGWCWGLRELLAS